MSVRILHGYVGLFFCAVLTFLSLTGTLAVFSSEIDWLVRDEMRVVPSGEKAPVGRTLDAVLAADPGARLIALARFPGARTADRVLVADTGNGQRFVWVDPYSGEVRGTTSTVTLKQTLRELHRSLSTEARPVQLAIAAVSLPLTLSVVTGLLVYRRFWTGFLRMPRWSGRRRAVLSDLHRLIAVWSLPFLVVVIATSLIFLSEIVGFGPKLREPPRLESARAEALPPGFSGAQLDRAVAVAGARIPGFELTDVQFPANGKLPLSLRGTDGTLLVRSDSSLLHLDPAERSTVEDVAAADSAAAQPAADMSPHLRVFEGVRVVHYGVFAGLPTRILWVVFGLGLTILGILGSLVAVERLRKEFDVKGRVARSGLRHVMSGPGIGNWIGLLAISLAVILAVRTLA